MDIEGPRVDLESENNINITKSVISIGWQYYSQFNVKVHSFMLPPLIPGFPPLDVRFISESIIRDFNALIVPDYQKKFEAFISNFIKKKSMEFFEDFSANEIFPKC